MDEDPLNNLLDLEDDFYQEGYRLGVADGNRAGHLEGKAFGLEKGYEKFLEMGQIHGKATIWALRLRQSRVIPSSTLDGTSPLHGVETSVRDHETKETDLPNEGLSPLGYLTPLFLTPLPANPRLEKHVQVLLTLVDPVSLSTKNTEDTIAEFDERLRRAQAKVKVIEKIIGEAGDSDSPGRMGGLSDAAQNMGQEGDGLGSIEDIGSLRVGR